MNAHDDVLAANEAFYRAFREGDLDAMDGLWATIQPVACVHPGWQALAGRGVVMASWKAIFDNPASPQVHARDATVFLTGDTAFVICTEDLGEGQLVATNVFVREEEDWRIVHHHAGPGRGLPEPEPPSETLH